MELKGKCQRLECFAGCAFLPLQEYRPHSSPQTHPTAPAAVPALESRPTAPKTLPWVHGCQLCLPHEKKKGQHQLYLQIKHVPQRAITAQSCFASFPYLCIRAAPTLTRICVLQKPDSFWSCYGDANTLLMFWEQERLAEQLSPEQMLEVCCKRRSTIQTFSYQVIRASSQKSKTNISQQRQKRVLLL